MKRSFQNLLFILAISCGRHSLVATSKAPLDSNIVDILSVKELNDEGYTNLINWAKEGLLEPKYVEGKNKLMLLLSELKADANIKSKIVKEVLKLLADELAVVGYEEIKLFDSADYLGRKTAFYFIEQGMLEELLLFINITQDKSEYDFGFGNKEDVSEYGSLLEHLVALIKSRGEIIPILDRIKELKVDFKAINLQGESFSTAVVRYENIPAFEWIKENMPDNFVVNNFNKSNALLASIQLARNEFFEEILKLALNKGYIQFLDKDENKLYGRLLLIHGALSSNSTVVKKLLVEGANINAGKLSKKIKKAAKATAVAFGIAADAAAAIALKTQGIPIKPPAVFGKLAKHISKEPIRGIDSFEESEEKRAIEFLKHIIDNNIKEFKVNGIDVEAIKKRFNSNLIMVEKLQKEAKKEIQNLNARGEMASTDMQALSASLELVLQKVTEENAGLKALLKPRIKNNKDLKAQHSLVAQALALLELQKELERWEEKMKEALKKNRESVVVSQTSSV